MSLCSLFPFSSSLCSLVSPLSYVFIHLISSSLSHFLPPSPNFISVSISTRLLSTPVLPHSFTRLCLLSSSVFHLFPSLSLFNRHFHLIFTSPPHFSSSQPQFIFSSFSLWLLFSTCHHLISMPSCSFSAFFLPTSSTVHLYSSPPHLSLSLDYISVFFCAFVHRSHS